MMKYIEKYKHGDAIFKVLNVDNVNRIIDVLVNIKGDGCLIEKPTNAEGRNWKIIFDGKQSDTPEEGGNADPEEPKPLDYLIRFVGGNPRESQYGDFSAQTDFNVRQNASGEWLRDTLLPLGYCYLTFNKSQGDSNTSKRADGISTGFSLKAQRKNGDKLYRLAHGNQHAAMMMEGDGNSIQIDTENYTHAPAYILRQWNTDNNYITIPKAAFGSNNNGYDFLTYDTYLPEGETRIQHPAEIKFASMNKAFFDDIVFAVTNIVKLVIDESLCDFLRRCIFTWLGEYHARCKNYNQDGLPYAAIPGEPHGGWIHLDDLEGLADFDDFQQLLADVRALYDAVMAHPFDVEAQLQNCDTLLARMQDIEAQLASFANALTQWGATIEAAIASLRQTEAELIRLESVATSQEQRVQALQNAISNGA